LAAIESRSLIIGINSDMLCPIEGQEYLAKHINNAQLEKIDSIYGHDGFLLESDKINEIINSFLN
jgi:homoserine O-acetyltransferase